MKSTITILAVAFALCAASANAQVRMPTEEEKAGVADALSRQQIPYDPMFDANENLRFRGLWSQYVEAPWGSADERRAWEGLLEMDALRRARTEAVATGVNDQAAWDLDESRRRQAERDAARVAAISGYNRVCRDFRSRPPSSWSKAQLTNMSRLLREFHFTTEAAPYPEGYVDPAPDRCLEDVENWLYYDGIDGDG